jgi:hypothetical protein
MSEQESRYTERDGSLDELAKGLATGTLSRGRALRMLGAALVGGAFASIPGAAWAACKQPFHKCTANSQCCSRQCIKNPQGNGKICGCPTGKTLCPAGNQCVTCSNTGEVVNLTTCKCECPSGTVLCNNACVSNVCSGGRVFNQATCKCECLTGQEVCSGTNTCVPSCDPTTGEILVFDPDTNNCRCECPTDTEMCGGQCRTLCPPGQSRNPQSCACESPNTCQPPQPVDCSGGLNCGPQDKTCGCRPTTEGPHFCFGHGSCGPFCSSSAQCPSGTKCVSTCCGFTCQFPCGQCPELSANVCAPAGPIVGAAEVNAAGAQTTLGG